MSENPFKVVVDALAAQTAAISTLAAEIQTEFDQYQAAVATQDTVQATLIAAAINERTAMLVSMSSALEASVPGQPGGNVDNTLPGDQPSVDNTLPSGQPPTGDTPGDPEKPGGGTINNALPGEKRRWDRR